MNQQPEQPATPPPPPRRFLRSRDDRFIAGVCGGLGRYFNVDPVLFRVGTVALLFDPRVEILGQHYRLFDVGGVVTTVGILVTLLVSVARNVGRLYRAEPLP